MEVKWERVPGAIVYELEMAVQQEDGSQTWEPITFTSRPRVFVEKLASGQMHTFRARAVGTRVRSPYSGMAFAKAA